MPGEMRRRELNNIPIFAWVPEMKSTAGTTLEGKNQFPVGRVECLRDIQVMKPSDQAGIYVNLKVIRGF